MRDFSKQQRDLLHGMVADILKHGANAKMDIEQVAKDVARLFEQDSTELQVTIDAHRLRVLSMKQQEIDGLEKALVNAREAVDEFK